MNMTNPHWTVEMDDRDLIASAPQGDRQAFTELVRRHQEGIVGLAYRMCGDLRLADDAARKLLCASGSKSSLPASGH